MSDPCEAHGSGPKKKKKGPDYYCMVQPPLTKQLKGILAEYPDGGQILKELIQNADDAGANAIKFLLDSRRINRDVSGETHVFTKFFQAPALCVYNDAEFTEEDWRGIVMVYSSVKENDRLKVGRFGLGFKSVFHITDHPCIISGDRIILMDPQQDANKVNASVLIKELDEIEGIDPFDFFEAFDNKFGVDEISFIQSGHFKGTLFWFPLREKESELSDNLYDSEKVMHLFKSVQSEASSILLFLKHLTTIRLEITSPTTQNELFADVSIENATQVKNERDKLLSEFKQMGNSDKDLTSSYEMKIETNIASTNCIQVSEWLVVNCIIGDSASNEFKRLIQSKQIGLSPFVGMAIPLHQAERIDGHVFCFLPLPKEGSKLTGLPFHVNGHFALSQNRHHIKWATDDQNHKYVNDDILWNEKMLEEALKLAFNLLYEKAIESSVSRLNTLDSVKSVYDIIPDIQSVNDKNWRMFVDAAIGSRENKSLVFCQYTGKWIQLSEATFTSFNALPTAYKHLKHVLRRVIGDIGLSPVDAPEGVLNTLRAIFPNHVVDISTTKIIELLHNSKSYINLDDDKKFALLAYLTSDMRDIKQLDGLKLLKLASGKWKQFDRIKPLYIVTEEELKMFPGLENRFVDPTMKSDSSTAKALDWIFDQHYFDVTILNDEDMKTMLIEIQETHLGSTRIIDTKSTLSTQWLTSVWNAIRGRDIRHFADQPLFPILLSGTFQSLGKIQLVELQKPLLLKAHDEEITLSSDLECCLKLLGITVIPELPSWISFEIVKDFIGIPSQQYILTLLEKQSNCIDQTLIDKFNAGVTESNINGFIAFLAQCPFYPGNTTELLSRLNIFRLIETTALSSKRVNVQSITYYIHENDKCFPAVVIFPVKCVVVKDLEEHAVSKLGLKKLSAAEFMERKLQNLCDATEKLRVLTFFLKHFESFERLRDIVRKLPFILNDANEEVKITEVFDPSDRFLCKLFADENDRFPKHFDQWEAFHPQLLILGMKGVIDITPDDVYDVAKHIDKNKTTEIVDKAMALQTFLKQNPHFLNRTCRSSGALGQLIGELSCFVFYSPKTDDIISQVFPRDLKWFSNGCAVCPPKQMKNLKKYWQIVSTSLPLCDLLSPELSSYYDWNDPPPSKAVLRHLKNIKHCRITPTERINFAPIIKAVYEFLENNFTESVKESIVCNALVWTDETFITPSNVVVHSNMNDLQLKPYFYFLPENLLSLETFFRQLGCPDCQDEYVLASVLSYIQKKYQTAMVTPLETSSDFKISLQVLKRLADKNLDKEWMNKHVIVLIESDNETAIEFAPLSKCFYDDDTCEDTEAGIYDSSISLVHSDISYEIANKLGIPSFNRRTLMDADNIEEWGQQEKFTRRLKTLLDEGYTDGISVAKELLQNADDAGATQLCFVYDKRKHLEFRKRLISKHLADFQGEALWCYNDQVFSEKDFTNIKQFNESLKRSDTSTIGKFGLGFTSVYNLTDLPSFISGNHMIMFDPHEKYLEDDLNNKSPRGKKIPLSKRALVKRHVDQFKPFEGLFGCNVTKDPFTPFSGTLFRFPLRTSKQSDESDISNKVYKHQNVVDLLDLLIRNADMLLLFTQTVSTIKILYVEEGASVGEIQEIYEIHKDVFKRDMAMFSEVTYSILRRAAKENKNKDGQELAEMHDVRIQQTFQNGNTLFPHKSLQCSDATWLITWFMNSANKDDEIVSPPLVAIATPCISTDDITPQDFSVVHSGTYITGHVFCFLPLPIVTGLPFHINGCFHVSSDRRMLTLTTEDDQSDGHQSKQSNWNIVLFQFSLVRALLKHIYETNSSSKYPYVLWPNRPNETIPESVKSLVSHFYRTVVNSNPNPKIFKGNDGFLSFDEISIIDPVVLKDPDIGYAVLQFITHVPIDDKKATVNVPDFIANNLRYFNTDRQLYIEGAFIQMKEILLHFLKNVNKEYWADNYMEYSRFLRCAIMLEDDAISTCLQTTCCIRTAPHGTLRMVKDLVHPSSNLAQLFSDSDERFISESCALRDKKVLARLVELGMMSDVLSSTLLIDRCKSIERIAVDCNHCAKERLRVLLKYLANTEVDIEVLDEVKNVSFLPVLAQPSDWAFTWHSAETINDILCFENNMCSAFESNVIEPLMLGKPISMFRMNCLRCVGSVRHILDENHSVFSNVYEKLGVCNEMHFTLDMLLEQLSVIGNKLIENRHDNLIETKRTLSTLYSALDKLSINMTTSEFQIHIKKFDSLMTTPIIDVGSDVVPLFKVAKRMKKTCTPDLFELPANTIPEHLRIFEKFRLKESFFVDDIISVLQVKFQLYKEDCFNSNIDNVIDLLINLEWCMRQQNITYEELSLFKEVIIAPDKEGNLFPTYALALEDNEFSSRTPLRLLNEGIPPRVAKAVGVRSKRIQLIKQKTKVIPFGQHEKLTTRLRGLLKDYPCDDSIMKELIQNSDDAGASEIHFIKYYEQKYIVRSVENGDRLQPALCVYNNKSFTEKDFEGIKNLGIGSKTDNSFKTGKFGVGFNAVYHITDMPSFLTKGPGLGQLGQVCMFDPLLKSISEISEGEPGIRYNVEDLLEDFPDSTLGYPHILSDCGTMFRFPLRSEPSEISANFMSERDVDNILDSFILNMHENLHFVKNLRKIKVLQYEQGKYTELYSVESELSENDTNKRAQFFQHIKEVCSLDKKMVALRSEREPVTYQMNLRDSNGENETWLVVYKFGSNDEDLIKKMISQIDYDDNNIMSLGGVSLKLPVFATELKSEEFENGHQHSCCKGKPYCFLPLTGTTGLPFHVNGNFAVDRGRRGLWRDEQGYRKQWNEFLLHGVVTECIRKALLFLQHYLINNNMPNQQEDSIRKKYLGMYFSYFPSVHDTTDSYWKGFVEKLYAIMIRQLWKVFPFVAKISNEQSVRDRDNDSVSISWIHLATDKKSINGGGLVNSLYKYNALEDAINIENVLKNLGIIITETPLDVITRIKQARQSSVVYTKPIVVMQIIKDSLTERDCHLGVTVLNNIQVVESLLKYMLRCKTFDEDVLGLPLCVTNNLIVNVFGKDILFCSEYCDLVPASSKQFLHGRLVSLLKRPKLFEKRILKEYTTHDLLQQLPVSYDPSVYKAGSTIEWKNAETSCFTPEFIARLFGFLQQKQVCSEHEENSNDEVQIFQAFDIISDWSFLPSIENTASGNKFMLIPFKKAHMLLEQPQMDDIHPLLSKLKIPTLDASVFRNCKDVRVTISHMIASERKPDVLLRCLYDNRFRFEGLDMTSEEATKLLLYFMQYKETILAKLGHDAKTFLKSLRLFEAIDGSFVSPLLGHYEILVISKLIPTDGLNDLSRDLKMRILKRNDDLSKLYYFLDLKECDHLQIYNDKIIPHMFKLQKHHWMAHIKYLKDMFTLSSSSISLWQDCIIDKMKTLPFILINGKDYTAMQLYDIGHPVFQTMSDLTSDITFLPPQFMDREWKTFMITLGLNIKPTGEMLIRYARILEDHGTKGLTKDLKEKSNILVKYLPFYHNVLQTVKKIKFVVPYDVPCTLQSIVSSLGDPTQFMCLEGSCHSKHMKICWSTVPLFEHCFDKETINQLNMKTKPTVDDVIVHAKRMCTSNTFPLKRSHMKHVYEYLSKLRNWHIESCRERLKDTPCISVGDSAMVIPSMVFVSSSTSDEIRPYLYKASPKLSCYFELFKKLGSSGDVSCTQYAYVLEAIRAKHTNSPLPPNELELAAKALRKILCILNSTDEEDNERKDMTLLSRLYLPNRCNQMCTSDELVIDDNTFYCEYIQKRRSINVFLGFRELQISVLDPVTAFQVFPKKLQPCLLSENVEERVSLETMCEVQNKSTQVAHFERFLRSFEFLEGFCRILVNQMDDFDPNLDTRLNNILSNTCIKEVVDLQAIVVYKDENVGFLNKDFFVPKPLRTKSTYNSLVLDGQLCLYFKTRNDQDTKSLISDGVMELITRVTEDRIMTKDKLSASSSMLLKNMLEFVDKPEAIWTFLDQKKIRKYDCTNVKSFAAFPNAGTYVDNKFHPFLIQAISPFNEREYDFAVLELETDDATNDDLLYIYVNIVNVIHPDDNSTLGIKYVINVGPRQSGNITVPIFRLYKFVKQSDEVDSPSTGVFEEKPFDFTCNQIWALLNETFARFADADKMIILRRLFLHCHLIKCQTDTFNARRTINYLLTSIIRLENNEENIEPLDENTGVSRPDMAASRFVRFLSKVEEIGNVYAEDFRKYIRVYIQSCRKGKFAHISSKDSEVCSPGEYRRWLNQAKLDFRTGQAVMRCTGSHPETYNWICYIFHQSCEKAVKAAWFLKNANKMNSILRSHSLLDLCRCLENEFIDAEARSLEVRLNIHNNGSFRLRYPDCVDGSNIPSDVFSKEDAEFALETAKKILDLVDALSL